MRLQHRAGRLVIAAGGLGFLKFIDGGWKGSWLPLQKDGATPVAFVAGTSAAFSFPVDADGDGVLAPGRSELQLTLTMRSSCPKQRLSVFVNEKPVATLDVEQTLQSYDVAFPAATSEPRATTASDSPSARRAPSQGASGPLQPSPPSRSARPGQRVPSRRGIAQPSCRPR